MARNFGFGDKWIRWMKDCISITMVSVLVNGAPTKEFQPQKGLRQGDPLSSFLFIIAAKGLNLLLARAKVQGLFRGANVGSNDVSVSHLQFADDTIIFYEGDNEDILNIKRVLRCFETMSGLPLGANPRKQSTWNPVVQKVKKKLSSWKRKLLSYAGSQVAVIFSVEKNVNKKKMHLVKWKEITKSKSQGGLGLRDLGEVKECLLLKWWWRYGNEDIALWKTVVCSRYGRNGGGWLPALSLSGGMSIVSLDIVKLLLVNQQLGEFYGDHFRIKVGNGGRIMF
ncbi:uncharacterized protein LOC114282560 [Camellia sinensis]|uniref:uncharacterized protein LOC114282560 n=1 Tax=Camellia sinensis TaxID=4442 RepID=UPI001035A982|nr:uncharacterized protein LOC114282560 [Camellia sinensis]